MDILVPRSGRCSRESKLGEAGTGQNVVYKGWEVEDPHLPDVPGPHTWVGVDEEGMFWTGTAAVLPGQTTYPLVLVDVRRT